jgi:RNA 2',3'-cyclic 3'-phosphodiesterase
MRTFVAIDLAAELKTAMETLVKQVRAGARGTKWVEPRGLHLTLKFLGWVSDDAAGSIEDGIRRVAAGRLPFPLHLKGTGTFPPGWTKNARVLWVGIEEDPGLMRFQKDLEEALEEHGFAREDRPFHPHLTLGRVKTSEGLDRILENLKKVRESDFGVMSVSGITFFQSVLGPSGAEYKPLAEVPFA